MYSRRIHSLSLLINHTCRCATLSEISSLNIQIHSPKMLASSAEKELEQEIDNDNAKIVGGDGVASADMEAGRKALVASADVVESDGEDGKNSYPSWVRPKHWYLDSSDESSTLDIESPRPTTSDAKHTTDQICHFSRASQFIQSSASAPHIACSS
ncbi:hypothetical protein F5887DRAFT_70385 [Amanita rubescens]|nr:hypothetical protein F5887DRAFT_70385 [Amanita rubescens]